MRALISVCVLHWACATRVHIQKLQLDIESEDSDEIVDLVMQRVVDIITPFGGVWIDNEDFWKLVGTVEAGYGFGEKDGRLGDFLRAAEEWAGRTKNPLASQALSYAKRTVIAAARRKCNHGQGKGRPVYLAYEFTSQDGLQYKGCVRAGAPSFDVGENPKFHVSVAGDSMGSAIQASIVAAEATRTRFGDDFVGFGATALAPMIQPSKQISVIIQGSVLSMKFFFSKWGSIMHQRNVAKDPRPLNVVTWEMTQHDGGHYWNYLDGGSARTEFPKENPRYDRQLLGARDGSRSYFGYRFDSVVLLKDAPTLISMCPVQRGHTVSSPKQCRRESNHALYTVSEVRAMPAEGPREPTVLSEELRMGDYPKWQSRYNLPGFRDPFAGWNPDY